MVMAQKVSFRTREAIFSLLKSEDTWIGRTGMLEDSPLTGMQVHVLWSTHVILVTYLLFRKVSRGLAAVTSSVNSTSSALWLTFRVFPQSLLMYKYNEDHGMAGGLSNTEVIGEQMRTYRILSQLGFDHSMDWEKSWDPLGAWHFCLGTTLQDHMV